MCDGEGAIKRPFVKMLFGCNVTSLNDKQSMCLRKNERGKQPEANTSVIVPRAVIGMAVQTGSRGRSELRGGRGGG